MAIPDFQTLMRPILELHADGTEHAAKSVVTAMADQFGLSDEERTRPLPSGRQTLINNRVAWAMTHMSQADLLDRPRRGFTVISERGAKVLADHPNRVDMKVLNQFPKYQEFRSRKRVKAPGTNGTDELEVASPPQEAIPVLVAEAHVALAAELVNRLRKAPPGFFERSVLRLLVKMGYGGPEGDSLHLGGPGDQGLDGLVKKDPLGFDIVYAQAKRYGADHTVGSQEVQAFVGALHGAQADRGVFITTTKFSAAAERYARTVPTRVVLIDGHRLGTLMVDYDYDCGVREAETVVIKEIDEAFFDET